MEYSHKIQTPGSKNSGALQETVVIHLPFQRARPDFGYLSSLLSHQGVARRPVLGQEESYDMIRNKW